MKKFIFANIFVFLFCFTWNASAQIDAFSSGDRVVNLGFGLGSYESYRHFSNAIYPIFGTFDYGIIDLLDNRATIGVGGTLAYTSFGYNGVNNWSIKHLYAGGRGSFHYQIIDRLDTYAGMFLGLNFVKNSHSHPEISGETKSLVYGFIGARYYFSDYIAILGEISTGISPLQIGVSFKF